MRILPFLLLASATATAQAPVSYIDFLSKDTSIRWAVQADKLVCLMPRTLDQSLGNYYRAAQRTGKLETWLVDDRSFIATRSNDSSMVIPLRPGPVSISLLLKDLRMKETPFDTTRTFDFWGNQPAPGNQEFFTVRQVVSYRNGAFRVDNILVSPMERSRDSTGVGWRAHFPMSFRQPGSAMPPLQKMIYLGTRIINYHLDLASSPEQNDPRILTPQNPNPIWSILADAARRKTVLPNLSGYHEDQKTIKPKEFFDLMSHTDTVEIRDVNDPARIASYAVTTENLDAKGIADYGIEQSFYFDQKHNQLYAKVHRVIIRQSVYGPNGIYRGRKPVTEIRYSQPPVTTEDAFRAAVDAVPDGEVKKSARQVRKAAMRNPGSRAYRPINGHK